MCKLDKANEKKKCSYQRISALAHQTLDDSHSVCGVCGMWCIAKMYACLQTYIYIFTDIIILKGGGGYRVSKRGVLYYMNSVQAWGWDGTKASGYENRLYIAHNADLYNDSGSILPALLQLLPPPRPDKPSPHRIPAHHGIRWRYNMHIADFWLNSKYTHIRKHAQTLCERYTHSYIYINGKMIYWAIISRTMTNRPEQRMEKNAKKKTNTQLVSYSQ